MPGQGVNTETRIFRDVFYFLIYLAFWAGMIYIAVVAFQQGVFADMEAYHFDEHFSLESTLAWVAVAHQCSPCGKRLLRATLNHRSHL